MIKQFRAKTKLVNDIVSGVLIGTLVLMVSANHVYALAVSLASLANN